LEIKLFSNEQMETVQKAFCKTKAVWAVRPWKQVRFRETENKPSVFSFFFGRCKKEKIHQLLFHCLDKTITNGKTTPSVTPAA
jgi:hypothetical protein